MKKSYIVLVTIFLIILICLFFHYKNKQNIKNNVMNFNQEYEYYNKDNLNGLDITTLINKAISNNEKFNVAKDANGYYVLDDENSIEIYITMIINDTTYRMERINAVGINSFIANFGEIGFKCTGIEYHKSNGKISSMTFEAKEY